MGGADVWPRSVWVASWNVGANHRRVCWVALRRRVVKTVDLPLPIYETGRAANSVRHPLAVVVNEASNAVIPRRRLLRGPRTLESV